LLLIPPLLLLLLLLWRRWLRVSRLQKCAEGTLQLVENFSPFVVAARRRRRHRSELAEASL